jgi:hypothetical protein
VKSIQIVFKQSVNKKQKAKIRSKATKTENILFSNIQGCGGRFGFYHKGENFNERQRNDDKERNAQKDR